MFQCSHVPMFQFQCLNVPMFLYTNVPGQPDLHRGEVLPQKLRPLPWHRPSGVALQCSDCTYFALHALQTLHTRCIPKIKLHALHAAFSNLLFPPVQRDLLPPFLRVRRGNPPGEYWKMLSVNYKYWTLKICSASKGLLVLLSLLSLLSPQSILFTFSQALEELQQTALK